MNCSFPFCDRKQRWAKKNDGMPWTKTLYQQTVYESLYLMERPWSHREYAGRDRRRHPCLLLLLPLENDQRGEDQKQKGKNTMKAQHCCSSRMRGGGGKAGGGGVQGVS
jgi:hypothetical protein